MAKSNPQTATARLAELRDHEQQAKAASAQAERAALLARNAAEQAEGEVVRAHAGHGSLDAAEKALEQAEAHARTARLKAQGAALRHEETEAELRQYHGGAYSQLVAEAVPNADGPVQKMLEGVRLILEGDAAWRLQCQEMDGHLRAAGHQPTANMRETHELAEVVRLLTRFDGKLSPPLPHGQGLALREQDEATKRRMKAAA